MEQQDSATQGASRVAVVTGGSRGLGRSVVLALAKRGVDSIFTFRERRDEADEVLRLVTQSGRRAPAVQLDTGDSAAFEAFAGNVRDALSSFGLERFDYLINNAGNSHYALIEDMREDDLDTLYRIHLKGPFFLTQKLLPLINDGGRVVNISTGLARFTSAGSAGYAAMKGAVEVLTRYMAEEFGARGIAVNTVAPGAIETDFSGGMVRDNPEINARIASFTALGRVGVPEDIGPMVAALVGDENRWINGQRIEVSGGMNL